MREMRFRNQRLIIASTNGNSVGRDFLNGDYFKNAPYLGLWKVRSVTFRVDFMQVFLYENSQEKS